MTKEAPQAVDVLTAFHNKSVGMARGSLEKVAAGNPSTVEARPSTAPKEKKSKRRDIATTTLSLSGTPRRPPRPSPIQVKTPSSTRAAPIEVAAVGHPLALFGGDSKFSGALGSG